MYYYTAFTQIIKRGFKGLSLIGAAMADMESELAQLNDSVSQTEQPGLSLRDQGQQNYQRQSPLQRGQLFEHIFTLYNSLSEIH